MTNSSFTKTRC